MQLSLALGVTFEHAYAEYGLRGGDFDVLTALRRARPPHALTPSELAESLMMSRAGMTKRLDRLEAADLVERALDPGDRRSFRISLTPRGLELIDAALTEHAGLLARLGSALAAEERVALEGSLRTLLRAVSGYIAREWPEAGTGTDRGARRGQRAR